MDPPGSGHQSIHPVKEEEKEERGGGERPISLRPVTDE